MTDTFDKIVEAVTPSRLLGRKPKTRKTSKTSGSTAAARKKHVSTIKKNLDKLAKDIQKLAEMVAGSGTTKKAPAKRRTARKTTRARKTARAKKS
jgi:hypothetical protein